MHGVLNSHVCVGRKTVGEAHIGCDAYWEEPLWEHAENNLWQEAKVAVWKDMEEVGIRLELWLQHIPNGSFKIPIALYVLTKKPWKDSFLK